MATNNKRVHQRAEAAENDWFAAFACAYRGDDERLRAYFVASASKLALEHDPPRPVPELPPSKAVTAPVDVAEDYAAAVDDPEKLSVLARRDRRVNVQTALLENRALADDDVVTVAREAIRRDQDEMVAQLHARTLCDRDPQVLLRAYCARSLDGHDTPHEVPGRLREPVAAVCARVGDAAHWRLAARVHPSAALAWYAEGSFPEVTLGELVDVLDAAGETRGPFVRGGRDDRRASPWIADAVFSGERLADAADGSVADRVRQVLSGEPVGSLHEEALVRALADDVRVDEVDARVDEMVAAFETTPAASEVTSRATVRCVANGTPIRRPLARLAAAHPAGFAAAWGDLRRIAALVDDDAVPALLAGNGRCRLAARIRAGNAEGTRGEELLASDETTLAIPQDVRAGDGELVVDHPDVEFAAAVLRRDTSWRRLDRDAETITVDADIWRWLARHGDGTLLRLALGVEHDQSRMWSCHVVGIPDDVVDELVGRIGSHGATDRYDTPNRRVYRRSRENEAALRRDLSRMFGRVVASAPRPPAAATVAAAITAAAVVIHSSAEIDELWRSYLDGEWGAAPGGDELAACLDDDVVSLGRLVQAVDRRPTGRLPSPRPLPQWARDLADRLPTPTSADTPRGRVELIAELLYQRVGGDPDRWDDAVSLLPEWKGSIGDLVDTVAALGGDAAAATADAHADAHADVV